MCHPRAKAIGRLSMHAVCVVTICTSGCSRDPLQPPTDDTLALELRWIQGYPGERRSDVETGLLWTLSFLGAALPRDGASPIEWSGETVFLHLDLAGIQPNTRAAWRSLLSVMKASEEYRSAGGLDIGRFVALALCSPRHYYALTGASARYDEARARHIFDSKRVAIVESAVASGNRILEVALGSSPSDIAFVAHEGTGSIPDGTFQVAEHELLEVMPNGQLRFALYDISGALKLAADNELTAAGKPSKCLWCHETELSSPFAGRTSVEGYYSLSEFEQQLMERSGRLHADRAALRSRIDFGRPQDHTYAELLYLSFYEPSEERLAGEWSLPVEHVRELVSGLPTHAHAEFPFLGDELYHRSDVDRLAPHGVIEVPTDPREDSAYEPDLIP